MKCQVYEIVVPLHVIAGAVIAADSKEHAVDLFKNDGSVRDEVFRRIDGEAVEVLQSGEILERDVFACEVSEEFLRKHLKAAPRQSDLPIGCKRPGRCADCGLLDGREDLLWATRITTRLLTKTST